MGDMTVWSLTLRRAGILNEYRERLMPMSNDHRRGS